MTVEVIDYDPATGVSSFYEWQFKQNKFVTGSVQSAHFVQNIVDTATAMRNDDRVRQEGIKRSMLPVCTIPIGVQEQLFTKYRINLYTQPKAALKVIQRDYPYLMNVTGRYA